MGSTTREARAQATELLRQASDGDEGASAELLAFVHDELARLARIHMDRERGDHTLQPTALVNEAWIRLIDRDRAGWRDREHFLSAASRAMRNILVDHARRRRAEKRGGGDVRLPLDAVVELYEERAVDLELLSDALDALHEDDPRLGRVVELRFFGGLTVEETARVMGVSPSTVERSWRMARAWLRDEIAEEDGA
jgi:RNA polymerase sigma factor (TIGR02999 family)